MAGSWVPSLRHNFQDCHCRWVSGRLYSLHGFLHSGHREGRLFQEREVLRVDRFKEANVQQVLPKLGEPNPVYKTSRILFRMPFDASIEDERASLALPMGHILIQASTDATRFCFAV